jgi:hypothetical protein
MTSSSELSCGPVVAGLPSHSTAGHWFVASFDALRFDSACSPSKDLDGSCTLIMLLVNVGSLACGQLYVFH